MQEAIETQFKSLRPARIQEKPLIESLRKQLVVVYQAAISQLSNQLIQLFMLEFYSRDSREFSTRNSPKQRAMLFATEGLKRRQPESSSASSPEPLPKQRVKTISAKKGPGRPKAPTKVSATDSSNSSPVLPKRVRRGTEKEVNELAPELSKAVAAHVQPLVKRIETLVSNLESLQKKCSILESTVSRMTGKLDGFSGVSQQVVLVDKRISQLDKKYKTTLAADQGRISSLEKHSAEALRAIESGAKDMASVRADVLATNQQLRDTLRNRPATVLPNGNTTEAGPQRECEGPKSVPLAPVFSGEVDQSKASTDPGSAQLAALTNVIERQGQQLNFLLQNSTIPTQFQSSQPICSPMIIPQSFGPSHMAHQMPSQQQFVVPQQPPMTNSWFQDQNDLARALRHLRGLNYSQYYQ
jgi:hypothetical protein